MFAKVDDIYQLHDMHYMQWLKLVTIFFQVEQLKDELNSKGALTEELRKKATALQIEVSAIRINICQTSDIENSIHFFLLVHLFNVEPNVLLTLFLHWICIFLLFVGQIL